MFGLFTTGVTIVTGVNGEGEPVGVTANSVTSVSLDPPLILWCLASGSRNLGAFAMGVRFAVHVLAEHQALVALNFARSGASKFQGDGCARRHPEPPTIDEALARMVCRVVALHAAGDHMIIVGHVDTFEASEAPPLVFQSSRFGRFVPAAGAGADEPWRLFVDMWS